jgi:PAS domain S-box-containing protein
MVRPINVLIVEDSENDTLLLLEELKKMGYAPMHKRVQTQREMSDAILERDWDVVISDYVMPNFSGPDALKILTNLKPGLPFITVSGTYGEEAAVHMMKAGASDYIVKNNLSRLVPAIERELETARARRARLKAEAAAQYLASIVESSEDAIYGKTLDSIIVSWNPAAERIYGYQAAEVIGRSIAILFPLDRRDELLEIMSSIRRGELVGFHQTERLRKDGRIIPVSTTISPIRNMEGQVIGASSIARDITKQKQADDERLRLIKELTEALGHVKKLSGLLPICASCKRIRDDQGYWQQVETYITRHTDAVFTHGICPECVKLFTREEKKLVPEF